MTCTAITRTAIVLAVAAAAFALAAPAGAEALRLDIEAPLPPKAEPVAATPRLKLNTVVEGSVIRLGDVVEDAGDQAGLEVAAAPAPGEKLALDADGLVAFARAKGLAVEPVAPGRKVVVARTGRTIPRETIVSELADALIAQGVDPDKARQIELANDRLSLKVPVDAAGAVLVQSVDYDPDTGRFTAILSTPGESATVEHVEIAGRLRDVTRVPVLRGAVAPGTVIAASDIDWIEMPTKKLGTNVVASLDQIVGQTPRRPLRAGAPVTLADMARPQVVAKNALVTMSVTTPNIALTAIGKALEPGALGDTIRLVNPSSNKTVQGTVTGPNAVRIVTGPQMASANAGLPGTATP